MSLQYPNTRAYSKKLSKMSLENEGASALSENYLTKILDTVSKTQFDNLQALQHANNKFFELQVRKLNDALAKSADDSTAKLSRGVPPPDSFTGQGHDDFASWLTHFRAIAKLNEWTPPVCADLLQTFLKNRALTYFLSLPQETRSDFEAAVAALRGHFDDSTVRQSLHIELHNRKQKLHESVNDFSHDLEKKFLRLNINES